MIIIDIQGFNYGSESFLCKEIAIFDSDSGCFSHRFVKMPVKLTHYNNTIQAHMNTVTRTIHGLEWQNNDCLEYEQLSEYIINCIGSNSTVFIKGFEKKNWLEKLLSKHNVIDLLDEGCPALEKLKIFLKSHHCNAHLYSNNFNCALENVYLLWYWYRYCRNTHQKCIT